MFRIVFFDISSVSLAKPLIHRAGYVEDEDNVYRSFLARGNVAFDILLKRHLILVAEDMLNGLVHDNAVCLTVLRIWLLSVANAENGRSVNTMQMHIRSASPRFLTFIIFPPFN